MIINFKSLEINDFDPKTTFEENVLAFIKEWLSNSKRVVVQTSGSTGNPKIFEVEKSKMLNSAKMTCDFLGLKEGNSSLLCLPTEYISGKMMVVRSIERKLKLFVEAPSVNPLKHLKEPVDFCAMTTLQVENSLDEIHLVKNLIIGGAAVSENLKLKIFQKFSTGNQTFATRIFETYGMSETLSHIALKQIYPTSDKFFTCLENIEITTDDRSCLKIFAPGLNAAILQTNDIVELKGKNQFRFLGRADNIINSGGAKIFPEELEAVAKKHVPNELVFLGLPDDILGQKLILVIEGAENESLKRIIQNLEFKKSFHKPKEIIFVDEIPRTSNGKIDRRKLKSNLI